MNQQAIEDYLKSIYLLSLSDSPVRTTRLAEERSVKPASVTNMVQRLAGLNLVNYQKHFGVTLTNEGKAIALRVLRYHGLLELFLMKELGYGWEEVHQEAETLEHVISERFAQRLDSLLGSPSVDPHGEPIPQADGSISYIDHFPLSQLEIAKTATVSRIVDDADIELLDYVAALGLLPGIWFELLAKAPFSGPLTLSINGEQKIIGFKAASKILVLETSGD